MNFQKISNDFTPCHEGLFFAIDTEADMPQDVMVEVVDVSADEVVATQCLREIREAEVNIAPYVKPLTAQEPLRSATTMFADAPVKHYTIRNDEAVAEPLAVSVNRVQVECSSVVTAMPLSRTIAYGETDELLIFAEPESTIEVNIVADTGEEITMEYITMSGAATLCISTKDFGKKVRDIEVVLLCNGVEFCALQYRIIPLRKGALRLVWVSDCGSIERYTFPVVVKSQRKADREFIDTIEGCRVVRTTTESIISVKSHYEPRATIEAIAQVLSSPRVWIEYPECYQEVGVLSTAVDVDVFGEPECVMLAVQEWRREERAL